MQYKLVFFSKPTHFLSFLLLANNCYLQLLVLFWIKISLGTRLHCLCLFLLYHNQQNKIKSCVNVKSEGLCLLFLSSERNSRFCKYPALVLADSEAC